MAHPLFWTTISNLEPLTPCSASGSEWLAVSLYLQDGKKAFPLVQLTQHVCLLLDHSKESSTNPAKLCGTPETGIAAVTFDMKEVNNVA